MPQTSTVPVTANSVLRSPAFAQGLRDYHLGVPIPLSLPVGAGWDYERGRLFAAATGARLIHTHRGQVSPVQLQQYSRLRKDGVIL